MHEIKYRALPKALRAVAQVFKEDIQVFECDNINEIIKVDLDNKLEMTVINQTDSNGHVERHFFIGVALDIDVYKRPEDRLPPQLYFALMNDAQFEKYKELINQKLLNDAEPK